MKKFLYGHDSQKNAYVIEDYPYGFLRTQKKIWVETIPKKGDRVVSQTLDPKKNIWNRPKASTFSPIRFLYLDEKGHVENMGVSPYSDFNEVKKFIEAIGGEKKLNKNQLQQYYDLSGKTLEGSDPTYTYKFDKTIKDNKVYTLDIKFDVANAVKLKHIIGAIDDVIGNTKKGKYGTPAETFKQLMADKGIIRVFGRGGHIIVGPMLADKTYQQIKSHLKNKIRESVVNEGIGTELVKVMTNKYNGQVKRNGLKKLGLVDWEINTVEKKYRDVYIGVAKKLGMKTNDVKDNFGNISVYLGDKTNDFTNALKKELSKVKIKESVNEVVVDILQYDLEPGVTLYYKRPEKDQERTFMFTDKKLNNVYKRKGSTIIFPMRDIYGYPKYPGKGVYKSEKVVGKINESNNNQTSKPEGLPKGKAAFLKTEGIEKNPVSWINRVAKWEKELEKMIGYTTLE